MWWLLLILIPIIVLSVAIKAFRQTIHLLEEHANKWVTLTDLTHKNLPRFFVLSILSEYWRVQELKVRDMESQYEISCPPNRVEVKEILIGNKNLDIHEFYYNNTNRRKKNLGEWILKSLDDWWHQPEPVTTLTGASYGAGFFNLIFEVLYHN